MAGLATTWTGRQKKGTGALRQGKSFVYCGLLLAMAGLLLLNPMAQAAPPTPPATAIVLLTQPTSGQSGTIRQQLEAMVRERFPGLAVHWAALPLADPALQSETGPEQLPDLTQVLADLKSRGVSRVVIQSLAVVPGGPWERELAALKPGAGLKVAFGKPLLSSLAARQRLLTALANAYTNNKDQAVLLVGGGQNPAATREYLALYTLILAKFKGNNLFIGASNSLPELKTALAGLQKSAAQAVTIIPLPLFIDGPAPPQLLETLEAAKAQLGPAKSGNVAVLSAGLGTVDGVAAIYGDHLAAALETLTPQKPERKKRGRK